MFTIDTTKTIAGMAIRVPVQTIDGDRLAALKAFRKAVRDAAKELGAPEVQPVGGVIDLYLREAGRADMMQTAKVKRPLKAARPAVWVDGIELVPLVGGVAPDALSDSHFPSPV